jgi:hypothetical protein
MLCRSRVNESRQNRCRLFILDRTMSAARRWCARRNKSDSCFQMSLSGEETLLARKVRVDAGVERLPFPSPLLPSLVFSSLGGLSPSPVGRGGATAVALNYSSEKRSSDASCIGHMFITVRLFSRPGRATSNVARCSLFVVRRSPSIEMPIPRRVHSVWLLSRRAVRTPSDHVGFDRAHRATGVSRLRWTRCRSSSSSSSHCLKSN